MRQRLIMLLLILVLFTSFLFAENTSGKKIEHRMPNEIAVQFKNGTSEEQISSFIVRFSEYRLKEQPYFDSLFRSYWFDEDIVLDDNNFKELIKQENIVEKTFFLPIIEIDDMESDDELQGLSDIYEDRPWMVESIDLDESLRIMRLDILDPFYPVVAIIDRGHLEFFNNDDTRYINDGEESPNTIFDMTLDYFKNGTAYYDVPYIRGNGIDNDNNGAIDDFGKWVAPPISLYINPNPSYNKDIHGSKIINIINTTFNYSSTSNYSSWLSGVRHFPIQCADYIDSANRKLSPVAVMNALRYVLKRRQEYNANPNNGIPFVAVNCSFVITTNDTTYINLFSTYVDSLGLAGVLTIAGAGNSTANIDSLFVMPASLSSNYVISVASHDRTYQKGLSSNYGIQNVDLAAPGVDVPFHLYLEARKYPLPPNPFDWYVPYNDSRNTTGTSYAAPLVAGTIAMMYRVAPTSLLNSYGSNHGALALQMKQWLLDAVIPVPSLAGYTKTGGRLNTLYAIVNINTPIIEIKADTTLTTNEVINKRYIIKNNARLKVQSSHIGAQLILDDDSKYYGFFVYSGALEFIDSTIYLGNGRIEVYNGSEVIVDGSYVEISDGNLILDGGSLLEITNGSVMSLSGTSKISGNTPEVIEGYYTFNGKFVTTSRTRGDRIYINYSQLHLGTGVSIVGGDQKWEGLFFSDCTNTSTISADISGIEKINLYDSSVSFDSSVIHDIGYIQVNMSSAVYDSSEITNITRLVASNDADLRMSDTSYHQSRSTSGRVVW